MIKTFTKSFKFMFAIYLIWQIPNQSEAQQRRVQSSQQVKPVVESNSPQPSEVANKKTITLEEMKQGIQKGQRFNMKKVFKENGGEDLFTSKTDNPALRAAYNHERLRDPRTGLIPSGIRDQELEYVNSSVSHLQDNQFVYQSGGAFQNSGTQTSPWVNRGPFNVGGRTRALALDINDETRILAGSVSGGLWESTDQGLNWTKITAPLEHPSVTDIVQDPRPGFQNIWYYSTGERLGPSQSGRNGSAFFQGNGVYKSTDNGSTWAVLPATSNATPQAFDSPFDLIFGVDIDPANGNLYVATFGGIFRSTDGGTSFEEVIPSDFDNFTDIHISPDGVLYASIDAGAGTVGTASGIFRSTDGAAGTWVNITDGAFPTSFSRTVIHTAPSNPDILYVLADGTGSAPVGLDFWKYTYVSGDGTGAGGTWENRTANVPAFGGNVGDFNSQGGYNLIVRVHPTDPDMVFIGGTNIYRSTDGFATGNNTDWIAGYSPLNNISLYTDHHPDQHSLVFLPSNPDAAISGHDGGLSFTSDITTDIAGVEPVDWTSLNNGYLTTQVYALSIGPQDQILSGFQDNSTWFTNNTNPQGDWTDLFSGDGSYNAFNNDGTLRYMSSQNGNIIRFTYADANSDVLLDFQRMQPAGSSGFLFVNPFEMDPNDDELMYFAAGNTLWRNDDLPNATETTGWTPLTNALASTGTISAIGISSSPANIVYYGTTNGAVVRIDNANIGDPAGVDISTGSILPGGNVTSIAVDPFNSNNVYVAFSNYSIPSLFFSNNGGSTWTDISGNLEENPDGSGAGPSVRWVNIVGNSDLYLVGTSTGMYSTSTIDGSSTVWSQVDPTGIGLNVVEQIRSRADGLVVAGTHGNGLFSATFDVSEPAVVIDNPIANIEVEANSADTQIDISNVFLSNEDPPLPITVSVVDNSNPTLLTASVSGNTLTVSYSADEFGEAIITVQGEDSNGETASTSFLVLVNPPPISSFPYVQDFEGGALPIGWETSGLMSWVFNAGGTPSTGTGPLGDNTLADGSGVYIYTEATGPNPGDQAILVSRSLDLTSLTNPIMEVYYHMFGAGIGALDIQVIDVTNGNSVTSLATITGPQQINQDDPYAGIFNIDLSTFGSSVVKLQFVATRGASFTSDIAIDDIQVFERPADNIGVSNITVSNDPFFSSEETLTIEITNFGTADQSNFPVSYEIDTSGVVVTESFTGTIAAGASATFNFATTIDVSEAGFHILEAFTGLSTDVSNVDDTLTVFVNTVPVVNTFPYTEDFESGSVPDGWELSGVASWILNDGGTPSGGTGPNVDNTIGDASGIYIYGEASGVALDEEGSFLTEAFDLSSLNAPILEFWYHMFGDNMGTLRVEVLDVIDNTESIIFELSGQQQSAQNDPYLRASKIDLSDFTTNLVRLKFTTVIGDGFESDIALDDITIKERPDNDLGIIAINERSGDVLTDSEVIEVTIVNFGQSDQSNFDLSYTIDGGTPVQETFTGTLASLDTMQFVFATTVDLFAPADYAVATYTELAMDEDAINDTTFATFVSFPVVSTLPYIQDFEGSVPLDNYIAQGTIPWLINSGGTPSDNTGPIADHTIGDATGTYIYAEVTGSDEGDQGSFLTDPIDISPLSNPVMDFWYHMHGVNIGMLQVDVVNSVTGEVMEALTIEGQQQANQDDPYLQSSVIDLSVFSAAIIQLRFTSTRGNTFIGDIAVDDIRVRERPADDIGVASIDIAGTFTDTETIAITVENFGSVDQTGFDVAYQVNDGAVITETFTGTIGGGETSSYTFTTTANLQALDTFNITSYTLLASDIDRANDTLRQEYVNFSVVNTFPYSEGFESDAGGWTAAGEQSSWELGSPNSSIINSASEGSQAWATNLTGDHNLEEQSFVVSPLFDFSEVTNPAIILDIWAEAAPGIDGAALQYSDDRGISWNLIGEAGEPDNWYNDDDVDGLLFLGALQGWDTTAGDGWVRAAHLLDGLAGQSDILLRVAFGASGGTVNEGFAFDNVRVVDLLAPTLSVSEPGFFSVTANWDMIAGAEGYLLDVSSDGFDTFVDGYERLFVDETSQLVEGLLPGVTYELRVRSAAGEVVSSANSNIESITTQNEFVIEGYDNASTSGFTVTWESVGDASGYELDVAIDDAFENLIVDSVAVTGTTFDVTDLTEATEYFSRVRATDGNSLSANTATFNDFSVPEAPTNLATLRSGVNIGLSWTDNSDGEEGIVIERSTDGVNFEEIGRTSENETSAFDADADAGVNYSYRVAAFAGSQLSEYSNVTSFLITGIEDDILSQKVEIAPNPSEGMYTIDLTKLQIKDANILVWNSVGKLILTRKLTLNSYNQEVELDIRNEEAGIYLLQINLGDDGTVIKRLMKK